MCHILWKWRNSWKYYKNKNKTKILIFEKKYYHSYTFWHKKVASSNIFRKITSLSAWWHWQITLEVSVASSENWWPNSHFLNLFCYIHEIFNSAVQSNFKLQNHLVFILRGHSQTTWTRFWTFFTPPPPLWTDMNISMTPLKNYMNIWWPPLF